MCCVVQDAFGRIGQRARGYDSGDQRAARRAFAGMSRQACAGAPYPPSPPLAKACVNGVYMCQQLLPVRPGSNAPVARRLVATHDLAFCCCFNIKRLCQRCRSSHRLLSRGAPHLAVRPGSLGADPVPCAAFANGEAPGAAKLLAVARRRAAVPRPRSVWWPWQPRSPWRRPFPGCSRRVCATKADGVARNW